MKKIITLLLILSSLVSFSQSTTVVISQVYSGGGTGTGPVTYKNDYVELHNISGVTQDISNFSLQYGSSTGNFGNTATQIYAFPAATSMPAGGYLLVQLGAAGTAGSNFPVTPDFITTNAAMGAAAGKVALVNNATALGCGATATLCTLPATNIVDLVSWGAAATNAEGGTPVPDLSKTTGAVRKANGCQDTNNNAADFDVVTDPVPRSSASPVSPCSAIAPALTVTGTINDFGTIFIGSSSASQTYNLSGTNLTGAPGNITITAPSTDFQVSNDNTNWGASTTIPYTTATLAPTAVWIRFTPQSAGLKTGNVTNIGGGITVAVNVAVSGNGDIPVSPVLSASSLAAFGNTCINTTTAPGSFTINGVNLTTTDITVGPLAGFAFATTAAGPFTPSLTLTQTGGTYTQNIYVTFNPTAGQSYDGNIAVTGGGATAINVTASGAGANNAPAVTTGAASLVTTTTATLAGNISSIGCSPVTVYGVEYSLTNGFANGAGTAVSATNLSAGDFSSAIAALAPSTTYYYKAYATNAGGTTYGAQQSFNTAAPVLTATTLAAFGNVCVNTTSDANSFTINSTSLTAANITVGPLAGYSFATTAAGTYTPSLSLTHPAGPYTQDVYVKFSPVALQNYSGNIPVSGGGASAISVAVSGTSNNAAPTVVTGTASIQPFNNVTLNGSIPGIGCSPVSAYGIVFSGIDGFVNGNGTKIPASNLNGSDFSISSNTFVQGTTYYYKAYAVNGGGVSYGDQQSFKTDSIPSGLVIYSSPLARGGEIHYSLDNIKPGHYQAKIYNIAGQLVYRRDLILQVNFIDDRFILPAQIRTGVYYLQIYNHEYKTTKYFMVQ